MTAKTIQEYIEEYDGEIRDRLETVYSLISDAVPPAATESIRWQMPAFSLGSEPLFFFTAAKQHLSFYPTSQVLETFADRIAGYATTQHAVKFPHRAELPVDLIRDMIAWRLSHLDPAS